MKTIIEKLESAGPSDPLYAKCDECSLFAYILQNQGCTECIVRKERKEKTEKSRPYFYCDLCGGIKYYITLEQVEGRKEVTRCLRHWGMESVARELKDLQRIGSVLDDPDETMNMDKQDKPYEQMEGEEYMEGIIVEDAIELDLKSEEG